MRVILTKTPVWLKFSTTGEMQWEEGEPRAPGSMEETRESREEMGKKPDPIATLQSDCWRLPEMKSIRQAWW